MGARKDDPQVMENMARWLQDVAATLGLSIDTVTDNQKELLDLISVVAHGPSCPGAPLTAFLVGYAAGATGEDPKVLAARIDAVGGS